jgi:hypothetical protein
MVTYVTAGSCTLTANVAVGNSFGAAGGSAQSFTISGAPVFTSASSTTFIEGKVGTFSIKAVGDPTLMQFTESGALPSGVKLSAGGVLSGSPTAEGTFRITITARNGVLPNASQSFSLKVLGALKITTSSLGTATIGTVYSHQLTESGGVSPFTWSNTAPKLPAGLTLSTDGKVTGKVKTNVKHETYSVGISLRDGRLPTHDTTSATLKIAVN